MASKTDFMLHLVGIGLGKDDISNAALKACHWSKVYVERYTSLIDDDRLDYLRGLIGVEINELSRSDLEENVSVILERSRSDDIAILIGGDPLAATTHKILFVEAKKRKVLVEVVHSASAITAIMGESGLDFYRFGQICTISRWSAHYKPISFYETLARNFNNNLHSILLLDYEPKENSSLALEEAVRILKFAEARYKGGIIADKKAVLIMHNLSQPEQENLMATVGRAQKIKLGAGPTALVVPAKLSDIEKEVLSAIY